MKKIVIIPTYNEVQNIEKMVKTLFDKVFISGDISVLIVDSNSPDGTAKLVENLQKEYKNLFLLKQTEKNGLASAYTDGFKYALKEGYDVLIQMDCDFQHPPEILPYCIEKTKEYDLVIASRFVANGSWSSDSKKSRSKLSELGNLYTRTVLNCPIKDMTGGYNIWTKKALEAVMCDGIISKGYMYQLEMKYRAYKKHLKYCEYPFIFKRREAGESKISKKIIFEALFNVWKLRNIA